MARNKSKSKKPIMNLRSKGDAMMKWGESEFEVPDGFAEHFKSLQEKAVASEESVEETQADMEMEEEELMVDQMEMEEGSQESYEDMEESEDEMSEEKEMSKDKEEESKDEDEEEKEAMDSLLSEPKSKKKVRKQSFDHKGVAQYLALLDSARSILKKEIKADSFAPDTLKRACIYKVCPKLKGQFDSASKEALDGAFQVAKSVHTRKNDSKRALNQGMFNSVSKDSKKPKALSALDAMDARVSRKGDK